MTYKIKESKGKEKQTKNPSDNSPPSCPTRGTAAFPTQPGIPSSNTRIDATGIIPELLSN
jgi:hypothetical protein